jgi:hypothetical protein
VAFAPRLAQRSGVANASQTLIFQWLGAYPAIPVNVPKSKIFAYGTAQQGGMS